jgi:two-component system OmpR family response regulator
MSVQGSKLLLVEDSSVLADRVAEIIGEIAEIDLVAVVDSESAALSELKRRRIQILVLDLHLKDGSGFGILRAVNSAPERPYILVLTNHDSAAYESRAIELGASAFLDKARDFDRLPEILKEIVQRGSATSYRSP